MSDTLAQLRTRAQGRADFENDPNVSTALWTILLNASRKRLRRILVAANPQQFVASKTGIVLTSSSNTFDLSTISATVPFWKALSLDRITGTNNLDQFDEIPRMLWRERNQTITRNYRIYGNTLEVRPAQDCAGTYTLWYILAPPALSADTDTLSQAEDMFDEFIILDAAIKARKRQGKDASDLIKELREELLPEIRQAAADNDAGEPDRVFDVEGWGMGWRPRLPRP